MLVLQFLDAIEELDDRLTEGESLHVWLVIRDRAQFESAAGVFLDLLMQARSKMVSVRVKRSGVPILDRFAARLSQRNNEDWAKWLLCRYAEIALELICYGLSRATRPATIPEFLFEEGRGATFGGCREIARRLATTATLDDHSWGARFFTRLVQDKAAARALETIVTQRNNVAHGRQSRPLAEIKKLVTRTCISLRSSPSSRRACLDQLGALDRDGFNSEQRIQRLPKNRWKRDRGQHRRAYRAESPE
jgi:hypothetical protein